MADLAKMAEEKWMSVGSAALALGVSRQWVVKLIDSGKLVAERTALGRLVDPRSVEKLRSERNAG